MDLRFLNYFVVVAEEENIHRAASRLNISQPPLSVAMKQLEANIGVDLFDRVGRGIKLTAAGQNFLNQARQIIKDYDQAKQRTFNIGQGIEGHIKIGFVSSSITGVLQDYVSHLKTEMPKFQISMAQSKNSLIPLQLLSREIDVGILRLPEKMPEGLKIISEKKEHWSLAVPKSHRFSTRESISLEELAEESLIFYPRENSPTGYDDVMNLFHSKQLIPKIAQEATEQMTIAALVVGGVGVGIVPSCMESVKIKDIVHVPIEKTANKTSLAIVVREEDSRQLLKSV
jgi:DNA-binding transcriptional LysR family regulator